MGMAKRYAELRASNPTTLLKLLQVFLVEFGRSWGNVLFLSQKSFPRVLVPFSRGGSSVAGL